MGGNVLRMLDWLFACGTISFNIDHHAIVLALPSKTRMTWVLGIGSWCPSAASSSVGWCFELSGGAHRCGLNAKSSASNWTVEDEKRTGTNRGEGCLESIGEL